MSAGCKTLDNQNNSLTIDLLEDEDLSEYQRDYTAPEIEKSPTDT